MEHRKRSVSSVLDEDVELCTRNNKQYKDVITTDEKLENFTNDICTISLKLTWYVLYSLKNLITDIACCKCCRLDKSTE